jgi:hypothetical protein
VAKPVGIGSKLSSSAARDVDSVLIRIVRARPGLEFGNIVRVAQVDHRIPRTTTARHLARLVRFGDLTRLPNRTYITSDSAPSIPRAVLEVRNYGMIIVIHPDGSARTFMQQEFRVVTGQLDHLEFFTISSVRGLSWWCSAAARGSRIPRSRSPTGQPSLRVDLQTPLVARKASWQWIYAEGDFREPYRMAFNPTGAATKGAAPGAPTELEWIRINSQGPRFGRCVHADAHLRLQIVFPEGYPVKSTRCGVRLETDTTRTDLAEEARLAKLAEDEWHQDGLQRSRTAVTLSVPRPLLDRRYEIEWGLPTTRQRDLWLSGKRLAR